jgi:2-haloacid dehalogenase
VANLEREGVGGEIHLVGDVMADVSLAFRDIAEERSKILTALELEPGDILFVSSNRWDIAGAAAFGFTPVWVNRLALPAEYPGLEPAAVVRDLSELLPSLRTPPAPAGHRVRPRSRP